MGTLCSVRHGIFFYGTCVIHVQYISVRMLVKPCEISVVIGFMLEDFYWRHSVFMYVSEMSKIYQRPYLSLQSRQNLWAEADS